MSGPIRVSVVVPVHDNAGDLAECLAALGAACGPDAEIVVVDDASTDDSAAVASRAGARVVRLPRNAGAAAARNAGVRASTGDLLVFVDSDVVVGPDTIARLLATLADPGVAAAFGSYDATPRAPGLVSQYRNLLHHFMHQHGSREASTFWSGCGVMRRAVFESLGGFDEGAHARAIEDIELGYRVRAAGHRIVLDRDVQATHLKRWTLRSVLWTDAMLRGLPWSRLILERRPPADLNITHAQRLSVALTCVAALCLAISPLRPALVVPAVGALAAVCVVDRRLIRFFARARGPAFAAASVPLLLLHHLESGACYAWARLERLAAP